MCVCVCVCVIIASVIVIIVVHKTRKENMRENKKILRKLGIREVKELRNTI